MKYLLLMVLAFTVKAEPNEEYIVYDEDMNASIVMDQGDGTAYVMDMDTLEPEPVIIIEEEPGTVYMMDMDDLETKGYMTED